MTQGGFEVDPDVVRAAAPKFDTAADVLKKAMETLFAGGQHEGTPWGKDEGGQDFAKGYLPAVEQARQGFTTLENSLGDLGDGLRQAADEWEKQDGEVRRKLGGK